MPDLEPTSKRQLVRTLKWVAGVVSIALIIAEFVFTNLPKVSADVSDPLRPNDPMEAIFNVSNSGLLPVYNVKVGCKVVRVDIPAPGNKPPAKPGTIYFPESHAEVLSPGSRMMVPCGRAITLDKMNALQVHAEMFIVVTYRPKWVWWNKSENFPMQTKQTENGTWVWKSIKR